MLEPVEKLEHSKGAYKIRLAEEKDFKKIVYFFKDCNFKNNAKESELSAYFMNPLLNEKYYFSELLLRNNLYNYREESILLEEDNELKGILNLHIPQISKLMVANVSLFVLPNDENIIVDIFNFAVKELPLKAVIEPTKIRIQILDNISNKNDILKLLIQAGFIKEMKLRNELGFDKNILTYVRYIPEISKDVII